MNKSPPSDPDSVKFKGRGAIGSASNATGAGGLRVARREAAGATIGTAGGRPRIRKPDLELQYEVLDTASFESLLAARLRAGWKKR